MFETVGQVFARYKDRGNYTVDHTMELRFRKYYMGDRYERRLQQLLVVTEYEDCIEVSTEEIWADIDEVDT